MALRSWYSGLYTLVFLALASAPATAAPPADSPLPAILEHTARIKLVDNDAGKRPAEVVITNRQVVKAIGEALGARPASGAGQRRCGDSVRMSFLDDKGVPLGRVGFCGTGGLYAEKSGEKPLSGPEFTLLNGGREVIVPIQVADPVNLLRLLRAALGSAGK